MAKLDDIQKTIAALSAKDLAKFRAWFATLDAAKPAAAAPDAAPEPGAGRLKGIAGQAIAGFKSGRTRNF